jgi:predicted O-linked N-acetylglucosamine transferase (SPINDLY family)
MHLCDWNNFDALIHKITERILNQQTIVTPFVILALIDKPEIHKQSTKIYIEREYPANTILTTILKYSKHQKIRIGYFSADFREHAVSYLTAELFESHDRDQFQIFAFSFGPNTSDKLKTRLENGFDQFFDVQNKTDLEVALLARHFEIDIAVDLGGLTANCRTGIFAFRAAPIQLSYIGYLGTMGTDYYDYLIADPVIIPKDYQQYYSEKIVYLPSYQVNDTKREVSEKKFTRSELGLPDSGFVFCCLNNTYKITPSTFDSWMRILLIVEGSVLLLLETNQKSKDNLKKEAEARGVNADRLIFVKILPQHEYLARYRIADLFLDSWPYNAGTTASDALRMGLPLVTLIGKSFASRMAASLLNSVGLPELITLTPETYESLAIELATNPQKLADIKTKLANNLSTCLLYNTKLFTQHIESAYQVIYQRYQDDLAPDNIYVTAACEYLK